MGTPPVGPGAEASASLPDDTARERVQHYEAHQSRHFYKVLHELQPFRAALQSIRRLDPAASGNSVDSGRSEEVEYCAFRYRR